MNTFNKILPILLVIILLLILCGICLLGCICTASLFTLGDLPEVSITLSGISTPTDGIYSFVTPTDQATVSTDSIQTTPSITPAILQNPPETATPNSLTNYSLSSAQDNLNLLKNTTIPMNDPIDLAQRLKGKLNLPTKLEFPIRLYQIGDQETFRVINADDNTNYEIQATLRYLTDHAYFWIEDGVQYNERHMRDLVDTFESKIYPIEREFFGSEWTPGVDADPHLFILYVQHLGGPVAGYFSSAEEYLPIVREFSNAHEMFFLSADYIDLDEEYAYSVLAHEFQHMIHWYRDRNEETWMNEGFSDLAMLLNGYSIGGADHVYVLNPDIQLNDWPIESASRTAHYGASFLFMTYFLDRFGEEVTKALVSEATNGLNSIDNILASFGIIDPLGGDANSGTGVIGADDVFADWVIASYLQDEKVEDGRYTYHNYPGAPNPKTSLEVNNCPMELEQGQVRQYGVDYIRIQCPGDYTLHFEGNQQVAVVPVNPNSGSHMFFSNQGDESDMTLTRTFDFRDYSGQLTLTYWTWYDIEKGYDYLYLTSSLDGINWQILTTPSGTANNPSGNSYGWAYNGWSGTDLQWIQEQVDISQFAGQQVQLRFEYVTDEGVYGDGFLLDDVAVPEINYFTDFENDDGGWQANGFVRIQNTLPQTFRIALINIGRETTVEKIALSESNLLDISVHIDDELILVVSGTTRFTRQKAIYQFSILP